MLHLQSNKHLLQMEGLSHKLRAVGVLRNPNEMAPFARAFSLHQPLFNFIDVGSGKERADYKIRGMCCIMSYVRPRWLHRTKYSRVLIAMNAETLRLFITNMQCKHVLFGGCHDDGYLPALDPYKRDPKAASRISLLETLPIQPGFAQLGYKVVSFPSIFRSEPLPDRPTLMGSMQSQQSATGAQQSIPVRAALQGAGPKSTSPLASTTGLQAGSAPFIPRINSPTLSTDTGASS